MDEKRLMTKTAGIIKKKLGTKSLKELINDEEFRNSIFHRFAVLKLPLRKGFYLHKNKKTTYLHIKIKSMCFRGHFSGRALGRQEGSQEEYSGHCHRD